MTPSELGVVVLTYGINQEFGSLLRQLVDQGVAPSDIVLVQNPPYRSEELAESGVPPVAILRTHENIGYTGGMNCGIRFHLQRDARNIMLVTHDVHLRAGAIRQLMNVLKEEPAFGVLGPAVVLSGSGSVYSYGGQVRHGIGRHKHDLPPGTDLEGIVPCDWIDGCVMLVRTGVLAEIGLLDEKLFMYFEDSELCRRASRAGWRIGVVPGAIAEQIPGGEARAVARYLVCRNGLEFARQSNGAIGVARMLLRQAHDAVRIGQGMFAGSTDRAEEAAARQSLAAIAMGVADFMRRRFGPPPVSL